MTPPLLQRLDSFPYRFRVREAMSAPLVTAPPDSPLRDLIRRMDGDAVSSVLIVDRQGEPAGIVTERDVLRLIARHGPPALDMAAAAVMSAPVEAVPGDAFLYVALGRMARLGLRHLLVTGPDGRPCGMVTARRLLRQRAGNALPLADAVAGAADAEALAEARRKLPALAAELLADRVTAGEIAAVIGGVIRELTGRAALLAAAETSAAGLGPAPAPWCCLVLGSAGRGESLLAADQDNALVHAGGGADDAWFAPFAERLCALVEAAGVPSCRGGVMASRADWRRSIEGWRGAIRSWAAQGEGQGLLNVDIFYDFAPVAGEQALAAALRETALEIARTGRLPHRLAAQLSDFRPPLGLFGRLPSRERRLDLKLSGLYPLVAGARAIALRFGWPETSTQERLARAAAAGILGEEDLLYYRDAHELFLRLLLEQQLLDIEAGLPPGSLVDLGRLSRASRRMLREALQIAGLITYTVRDAVAAG